MGCKVKTEQVLQKLDNDVTSVRGDHVALKKEDAKLILERMKHLESIAAALLRFHKNATGTIDVVLPYQAKPT